MCSTAQTDPQAIDWRLVDREIDNAARVIRIAAEAGFDDLLEEIILDLTTMMRVYHELLAMAEDAATRVAITLRIDRLGALLQQAAQP